MEGPSRDAEGIEVETPKASRGYGLERGFPPPHRGVVWGTGSACKCYILAHFITIHTNQYLWPLADCGPGPSAPLNMPLHYRPTLQTEVET